MAKDMRLVLLLDFYGGLLTGKQSAALDGYYNRDLSLAEIAEEMGISRQGVMAFIKQGEKHLREFEDKLGLAARFSEIAGGLEALKGVALNVKPEHDKEKLIELIDNISAVI